MSYETCGLWRKCLIHLPGVWCCWENSCTYCVRISKTSAEGIQKSKNNVAKWCIGSYVKNGDSIKQRNGTHTNNLLNQRRFVFLSFDFGRFYVNIHIRSEEIPWNRLYFVYDNDVELKGNLKKTPKISKNVLHPRKFKQTCHSCIRHSMIQE